MISTNFNIPTVQYTPLRDDLLKKGEVSFFNAIGAGIGISISDVFQKTSKTNEIINTDVKNNIGFQIGFLFSSTADDKSKFAYTMALQLLDFQLGWGHQLGEVTVKQYRNFFNISYSIPLNKFTGAKYFQLRFKTKNKNLSFKEKGGYLK